MFMCKLWLHRPPPAAATVAGEAPARRSWFCREKSMLYHSAALSTGLGGITRLGFSRTSRTYRKSMLMAKSLCVHRSNININRCLQCKRFDVAEHHLWYSYRNLNYDSTVFCGEYCTSKSVKKWMASGSVTRRFLFSTSFFSLPHLNNNTRPYI